MAAEHGLEDTAVVRDDGTIEIPERIRRALGITGGASVRVTYAAPGELVIRATPAGIAARRASDITTLGPDRQPFTPMTLAEIVERFRIPPGTDIGAALGEAEAAMADDIVASVMRDE